MKNKKEYIEINNSNGWQIGYDLFYECLICGTSIPSIPTDNVDCKCHNFFIDVDYGRMGAIDESKIKLYRKVKI